MQPQTEIRFSEEEIRTMLEALGVAASRRESQARACKHGRRHDLSAIAMRRLRFRLLQYLRAEPCGTIEAHGATFNPDGSKI